MLEKIHKTLIIPITQAGERLDQALAKLLPEYSRTQIHAWIKLGKILVNNRLIKSSAKLKGEEIITLEIELFPKVKDCPAQPISLDIVYEDEALIVINKPVGLVVHPGAGHRDQTLLNALLHYSPSLEQLPRAGILHRLDKNTSGLLIIAKTPLAFKHLSQQLKERSLVREYKAVVYGLIISGGVIAAPIGRHPIHRTRMSVVENGKEAITHYRVIEKFRAHTLLKLSLETGRTHQIRVHLAHLRHPLVGDISYGGRVKLTKGMREATIDNLRQFKRQALHAFAVGLIHPDTNELLKIEINLPEDMNTLIHILREDMVCQRNHSQSIF